MTEEQQEACKVLGSKYFPNCGADRFSFKTGFKAAQSPEMLMLNPLVKGLVETLEQWKECVRWENMDNFSISDFGKFNEKMDKDLAPFKEKAKDV